MKACSGTWILLPYLHKCRHYDMVVPHSYPRRAHSWHQSNQLDTGKCTIVLHPHRYLHSDTVWQHSRRYWSGSSRRCILPDTCKCRNPSHWYIYRYFGTGLKRTRRCSDRRNFHCTPEHTDKRMFQLYRCRLLHWHKACVVCRGCKEVHTHSQYIPRCKDNWNHSPAKSTPEITNGVISINAYLKINGCSCYVVSGYYIWWNYIILFTTIYAIKIIVREDFLQRNDLYITMAMVSSDILWNIPRVTCFFSIHTSL